MPEKTILDKIVEQKKIDLEILKKQKPLEQLKELLQEKTLNTSSFFEALNGGNGSNIIAEIKRRSPSKGPLRPDLDPINLATEYTSAGAKAISVLTEEKFFGGSDTDLVKVASKVTVPILRKDFTVDEYQIWEAKLIGASAILLIAAVLSEAELTELYNLATEIGLDVLVEVHNEEEAEKALKIKPQILGVNNRNLHTFEVSLNTSVKLIHKFGSEHSGVWVSESGIHKKEDILMLTNQGFKAFLIGESLLKSTNPSDKLKELLL